MTILTEPSRFESLVRLAFTFERGTFRLHAGCHIYSRVPNNVRTYTVRCNVGMGLNLMSFLIQAAQDLSPTDSWCEIHEV